MTRTCLESTRFLGFLAKIIRLLRFLYSKSHSAVQVNRELTNWFKTRVGVRQGCVISPQLFKLLLEMAMLYAIHDTTIAAQIQGPVISNLNFVENANDLQTIVNQVFESTSNLELKILHIKKKKRSTRHQ